MPTAMNISKLKREPDTDVSSYYSEYDCTGSLGIKLENTQRMQARARNCTDIPPLKLQEVLNAIN